MSKITIGGAERELRITARAIRIIEGRIGKPLMQLAIDVAEGGNTLKLGLGDAMEIAAAGLLHEMPKCSVQAIEKWLDEDPELTFPLLQAVALALLETFKRLSGVKDEPAPLA